MAILFDRRFPGKLSVIRGDTGDGKCTEDSEQMEEAEELVSEEKNKRRINR